MPRGRDPPLRVSATSVFHYEQHSYYASKPTIVYFQKHSTSTAGNTRRLCVQLVWLRTRKTHHVYRMVGYYQAER